MLKILIVFGTRPELIKLAPVIKEFEQYPDKCQLIVCDTCQHDELVKLHYGIFKIKPKYSFKIMKENQSIFYIFNKVLVNVEKIIKIERPDYLLVQGDTTTALSAAWAGFLSHTKIVHIEAGLRTGDLSNPFPEEANRKVIDHLSDILFAPTKIAYRNLLVEGFPKNKIFLSGNTVIDTLKIFYKKNSIKTEKIILLTVHRRESYGYGLNSIFEAIKKIAMSFPEYEIIFPAHLSPNIKKPALLNLKNIRNIKVISPLEHNAFINLLRKTYLILTDSGGVVEEASFFGKPALILREKTERLESLKNGIAKLVGFDRNKIVFEVARLIKNKNQYQKMARRISDYGDGNSAGKIVKYLINK